MRGIETSITQLLSECPSFRSAPSYWAKRGTEKHKDLAKDEGVLATLEIVEKSLPRGVKIAQILDIEGSMTPVCEGTMISELEHRAGERAYFLRTFIGQDPLYISGVPDIVLELSDGRIAIVDHKTGGRIHDFRQVTAYALMASKVFNKTTGAIVMYIHHDMQSEDGPIVRQRSIEHADLEAFWSVLDQLIKTKLGLSLRPTAMCRYCSNVSKCPSIMLLDTEAPQDMGFVEKVQWYIDRKAVTAIASDIVKKIGDDIVAMVDMGENLPDFAVMKQRVTKKYDVNSLIADYPGQVWAKLTPVGVSEIRKQAKSVGADLSKYEESESVAKWVEPA